MISHHKKFIFIHIPKTAGFSMLEILKLYRDDNRYATGHATQRQYSKILDIQKYYQFAFVRNPWDRLCSAFFFLKSGGMNKHDQKISEKYDLQNMTFTDFVLRHVTTINSIHCRPQYKFIEYKPADVDIHKFEDLHKGFDSVCTNLNVNHELTHINKSKHKHYTEYYDDETREIIAKKYAKDIEYFGYKFGE